MEIFGGIFYTLLQKSNISVRVANRLYSYFTLLEYISSILMLIGVCLSIKRTIKTSEEHKKSIMEDDTYEDDLMMLEANTMMVDEE
jgi:hypothetical protein